MKTSMIAQLATLAFAFTVTAGPVRPRCENELEVAAASSTGGNDTPVVAKTTKSKKAKSSKTKAPKATDTPADGGSADSTPVADAPESGATSSSGSGGGKTQSTTSGVTTPTASGEKTPVATGGAGSGSGGGSGGGGFPAASGTSVLAAAQTIAAGASFDGGMVAFDRGTACTGQSEGGDSAAVFILEAGASLSNVIIGPNQSEGVHCNGGCKLTNVWWSAVCEDAFTIKLQDAGQTTTISGGGAKNAADKVLQHNGAGTLSVSDFLVEDFGKLYRSCGNCKVSNERHIIMDGITANTGDILVGINPNFGDTAKITNSKLSGVKEICTEFKGVASGSEPSKVSTGASAACAFGADVVSS